MNVDPITNAALPADAIQRVLYLAPAVHIYRIPPPSAPRYLTAANWTTNPADHIFTARLRLVETAIPKGDGESVSATILLEDASSGELFAAAPYNHASVVEQATDSSRFFAIRVVGEGGMKATLGLGYEQRPDAFDFSIALQDVRRVLGFEAPGGKTASVKAAEAKKAETEAKRDLSLKDGEMITIKIGGKGRKSAAGAEDSLSAGGNPGASGSVPVLAPPPETKASGQMTAEELGFDDGEFGEFQ
ncbi:adaptin ear-binding coat-associated protein 1 NECAP-1 [Microthyrium microscopicum]|uniref:Adaptin ear-binding coat-associated protein 1 NECAP-1 n=1 Tax=Microthyrium microscopicum TaxID=703497 RepID=A0A6A6UN28_9PEZI|nr:adaptin ear-binding coat-associated protein 1 NECAP-1 [Microthyrium microscopicum]